MPPQVRPRLTSPTLSTLNAITPARAATPAKTADAPGVAPEPVTIRHALETLNEDISRTQTSNDPQAAQRLLDKAFTGAKSLPADQTVIPTAPASPLPRLNSPTTNHSSPPKTSIPATPNRAHILKWAPLTGLAVIGIAHLGVPWLTVMGWAANLLFILAPWVQIVENFRNIHARNKGGDIARAAMGRLAGVSSASQLASLAGNLFNYPTFLASGSPVLIGNALLGTGNAMIILAQLAWTRHFARWKLGLVTAAALAAIFITPLIMGQAALAAALGLAATAAFSVFTVPQVLKNNEALAALRLPGRDPAAAQEALEHLRGINPLYLLAGMLGNMLFLPVSLVSGRWYNVATVVIGVAGPLIVLRQLSGAGLFPKWAWAPLAAVAAAYVLGMLGVAALAPSILRP